MNAFKLKYAPHLGLNSPDSGYFLASAGKDEADQIKFIADQGFGAIEDNFLGIRPVEVQKKIGRELEKSEMEMGVFVASIDTATPIDTAYSPGTLSFVSDRIDDRERLRKMFEEAIEISKRVNNKIVTVLSGPEDLRIPWEYQTANMIENLKYCADVCEKSGLVMGLEPINGRQWPGTFVKTIPHAYLIAKAVASPSLKLIFDSYHVAIETGNIIENFMAAWDEVAYIQVADNLGRLEPGTGEINYESIFRYLRCKKYSGIIGLEHGHSRPGKDGELASLENVRKLDSRL